jgi:hypothetical protein
LTGSDQVGHRFADERRHDVEVGPRLGQQGGAPCGHRPATNDDDALCADVEQQRIPAGVSVRASHEVLRRLDKPSSFTENTRRQDRHSQPTWP